MTHGKLMASKSIAERKKDLQDQIAKLEAEEKKQAEKRHTIIGRVVELVCNDDSYFKSQIDEKLAEHLTNNAERQLFDLPKLETKRGRPASPPPVSS